MRVQRDRRPVAEPLADNQVDGADHAVRAYNVPSYGMLLDNEAQSLEQCGSRARVRGAIAWRIVGRNFDEFCEETRLCLTLPLQKGVHPGMRGVCCEIAHEAFA